MDTRRRLAIGLAGGAQSGKTTIAAKLADRLQGRVVGFGDYIRHVASSRGEPIDRFTLQRIGQEQADQGAEPFVAAFLEWAAPSPDETLIIDGVRHVAVDDALRAWADKTHRGYALVVLDASIAERSARLPNGAEEEIRRIDNHPVEQEISASLPKSADCIIEADGTPEEVFQRLLRSPLEILTHVQRSVDGPP